MQSSVVAFIKVEKTFLKLTRVQKSGQEVVTSELQLKAFIFSSGALKTLTRYPVCDVK